MQVTVTGTNCDVPERIRDEAIAKLSKVRTIFDRFIDMDIVFTEETSSDPADRMHCEVVLHAKGRYLRATAAAPDMSIFMSACMGLLGLMLMPPESYMTPLPTSATLALGRRGV